MRSIQGRHPGLVLVAAFTLGGCSVLGGATPTPAGATLPPALPSGTYTSSLFQPQVTFTLPAGWWIPVDQPDYLELQPVTSDQVGVHFFRNPLPASQAAACPTIPEPSAGTLSTQLLAWIRELPGLKASNPRLTEVGGLRGAEIDLSITDGWTTSCPFANGLPTVSLFVGESGGLRWVVAGSEQLRLSILDAGGFGTVVVDVDAYDGTLMAPLLQQATPIVRSLRLASP